jgi:hypothetical protein
LPGVDLDLFEPSQAVKAIERSAFLSFNPAPQRENVHSAFEASMSKALSMPWSLQCGDNSSPKESSNALMQRNLAINSASVRL